MNIAYLHGLESSIKDGNPKIIFLNDTFDQVYAPSIDYRDPFAFDQLLNDIKEMHVDLIIGSSMGGYVSYLIGSKLSVPTLLFNPAVCGRSFDPTVDDSKMCNTKHTVYLGKNDMVIDGESVMQYFDGEGVGSFDYNIYDGGHKVPTGVFIDAIKKTLDI